VPKGPFLQKRKEKNVSNVLIKLILKKKLTHLRNGVPEGPLLQKRKRKNVSNVLIIKKKILSTPLSHITSRSRTERSVPAKKKKKER
jgi:hypothetical protein